MISNGVVLSNNSNFVGSSVGNAVYWQGGRSALVVNGSAYSAQPGLNLQTQGPTGPWINIGPSVVSDQSFPFDAIPGSYRLVNLGTSSCIGITASLVTAGLS